MTSIPCTALLDAFALFRRCIATRVVKVAVLAVPCTALAFALLLGTFLILVIAGTFVTAWVIAAHAHGLTVGITNPCIRTNLRPCATNTLTTLLTVVLAYAFIARVRWFRFGLIMALTVPPILAFTFAYCRVVTRELFLTGAFVTVVRVITTKTPFSTSLLFYSVVVKVALDSSYIWIFKGASIKGILHITYICVYSKVFHIQLVAIHDYIESVRVLGDNRVILRLGALPDS